MECLDLMGFRPPLTPLPNPHPHLPLSPNSPPLPQVLHIVLIFLPLLYRLLHKCGRDLDSSQSVESNLLLRYTISDHANGPACTCLRHQHFIKGSREQTGPD